MELTAEITECLKERRVPVPSKLFVRPCTSKSNKDLGWVRKLMLLVSPVRGWTKDSAEPEQNRDEQLTSFLRPPQPEADDDDPVCCLCIEQVLPILNIPRIKRCFGQPKFLVVKRSSCSHEKKQYVCSVINEFRQQGSCWWCEEIGGGIATYVQRILVYT